MVKFERRNKKLKIFKVIFLLAFFTSYELRATSYESFAQDKIVAIVNSDVVTQKDLNDFINFTRMQLSTEYKGEQLEGKIRSVKADLLNKLIDDRLILQEARKSNIKIDQNRIRGRIEEIKRQYSSEGEFQRALAQQGFVQSDIETRIKEQLLMHNIIEIKIKRKIAVNPAEVTDFYRENTEKFILPQMRDFVSLATPEEKTAKAISEALRQGEKPEDVADRYSVLLNKFSAAKDGQLRKEIEGEIFRLNAEGVSEPIKIQDNYYIFKLISIIPPRKQNLSEAQESIYSFLTDNKLQEGLAQWLDELKTRSYIKIIEG